MRFETRDALDAPLNVYDASRRTLMNGNTPDGRELLLALRRRETGAIARVYDAYARRIYSLAYRILGDHGAAEEAVQDAFVDLWRNTERLDPSRGQLESLLLTVVRFKAIDRLRKRRGQAALYTSIDIQTVQDTLSDGVDTAAMALERSTVQAAMASLPAEQSRVVELAYFGGYTHIEIAEITRAPLGTVKSRLRLALERLRTTLEERDIRDLSRGR